MHELRTPKVLNGMEFGCPSLSVQAWYTVRHGAAAWEALDRIPRQAWAEYLGWYRTTLDIRVESDTAVTDIRAGSDGVLAVETRCGPRAMTRLARTVVIATGFDGAGSWRVPDFVSRACPATVTIIPTVPSTSRGCAAPAWPSWAMVPRRSTMPIGRSRPVRPGSTSAFAETACPGSIRTGISRTPGP